MKLIFLDIDGVLNCQNSRTKCMGFIGIDDDKVKRLKQIVDATDAKIILCSSWKNGWEPVFKDEQREDGHYIDRKMKRQGLKIINKTDDKGSDRGAGIKKFLENFKSVDSWIVLDDEVFDDYEELGIMPHLVQTDFYNDNGGIQEEHVQLAIKILNNN